MSYDIPLYNRIEMDRGKLIEVLEYFGYCVGEHFPYNVRLVIHGGACMLLHPGLYNLAEQQAKMTPQMQIRKTTRDVDFLGHAFADETIRFNDDSDAPQKLRVCIRETAIKFGLGADWMNSDPDVALPKDIDSSGRQYHHVHIASTQKTNIEHYTVFTSRNGMVTLISVPPVWAIALKLVRYNNRDSSDICLLLKYCKIFPGITWSRGDLGHWLERHCERMYARFHPDKKTEFQRHIDHAVMMVNVWCANTPAREELCPTRFGGYAGAGPGGSIDPAPDSLGAYMHVGGESVMGTRGFDQRQFVWGGGDDGSRRKPSFAGDWGQPDYNLFPSQPARPGYQLSSPQHYSPHGSGVSLSPLSGSDWQGLATLGSVEQQNRPLSVADWVTSGEALDPKIGEQTHHKSRERGHQRDREQEATMPFIPPPDALFTGDNTLRRHQSEPVGCVGHAWGQQNIYRTGPHSHRPRSQLPVYSRPRPAIYSTYSTPPFPNVYIQQNQPRTLTNGSLATGNPSSYSLLALRRPSPPYEQNGVHPPDMLCAMPTINLLKVQIERKTRRRSSSRKRGGRASAQDRPQKTITQRTTVTYYNQQHQPDGHALSQVTLPQSGQFHHLTRTQAQSSITNIAHTPTLMTANILQFPSPIPSPISNHRPMIPTDEQLQPERWTGTFQKLVSKFKPSA